MTCAKQVSGKKSNLAAYNKQTFFFFFFFRGSRLRRSWNVNVFAKTLLGYKRDANAGSSERESHSHCLSTLTVQFCACLGSLEQKNNFHQDGRDLQRIPSVERAKEKVVVKVKNANTTEIFCVARLTFSVSVLIDSIACVNSSVPSKSRASCKRYRSWTSCLPTNAERWHAMPPGL